VKHITSIAIDFDGYAYAGNCRTQRLGRLDKFDLYQIQSSAPISGARLPLTFKLTNVT
jgi:hypothetical protein